MKRLQLKTSYLTSLSVAFIALTACTQNGQSAMLITASDDGNDMTLQWSGSLDLTGVSSTTSVNSKSVSLTASGHFNVLNGYSFNFSDVAGKVSSTSVVQIFEIGHTRDADSLTGLGFGWNYDSWIFWDSSLGNTPGLVADYSGSIIISGATVSSVFGNNISNTPTQIAVLNATGDTISIATASSVPEPCSITLLGLSGMALFWRRRKS